MAILKTIEPILRFEDDSVEIKLWKINQKLFLDMRVLYGSDSHSDVTVTIVGKKRIKELAKAILAEVGE